MFGAVLLLGAIVLIARPKWPNREAMLDSCATGVFMHALYLGGVYISIANGLPAALSALVVGLQPLLTSTIANRLLGERVVARQWGGLLLGIAGVYLVGSRQGDYRGSYAARVGSIVSSSAEHHVRHDLSKTLRQWY